MMNDSGILIISADEVQTLLRGREREIIEIVGRAYIAHQRGDSALPHSTFLRFPDNDRNRIIALPAFLGSEFNVAGIKWISSFPNNVENGQDRATAVIILNSIVTGRPETILEGSQISAKRTAASAALAAQVLTDGQDLAEAGLIGCGLINFEIARFLLASFPRLTHLTVFDLHLDRAKRFADQVRSELGEMNVTISHDPEAVLASSPVVSIATTATKPHIHDLSMCKPGAAILHVSLRDIAPQALLHCYNLADDMDHVCRAQTSVHLAEQMTGNREFSKGTLADFMLGETGATRPPQAITIFHPFGLGILDLALSARVCELARRKGMGTVAAGFLPACWSTARKIRTA